MAIRAGSSYRNILLWFNVGDLRLHDNYAVIFACRRAKELVGQIYPCFCFDPRTFSAASEIGGFLRSHPRRARFAIECVADLRKSLWDLHQHRLLIRLGSPEDLLGKLACELQCCEIFAHDPSSPEEREVQQKLQSNIKEAGMDVSLRTIWGSTLLHIDDLSLPVEEFPTEFRRYADLFYRSKIRRTFAFDGRKTGVFPGPPRENVLEIGGLPTLVDLGYKEPVIRDDPTDTDSRQVLMFKGGETEACERVRTFMESDCISNYGPGRTDRERYSLFGHKTASRLSPWLAHGCISPRRLYELVAQYSLDHNSEHDWSCRVFLTHLLRRDYWTFFLRRYGASLYAVHGPTPASYALRPPSSWGRNPHLVHRWCNATTGLPFVDAAMRELTRTGYTATPGRRAVFTYLVRGLQQDWRIAAEWLQRNLLDYDPGVCWGNAALCAGLVFDLGAPWPHETAEKLQLRFDGAGRYTRLWVPELHNVPTPFLHRPQAMTREMQEIHKTRLGVDYPHPVKLWYGAERDARVLGELQSYVDLGNTMIGEGYSCGTGFLGKGGTTPPLLSGSGVNATVAQLTV